MRVTVAGKRIEKSTGRSVEVNRWNSSAGKTKGNNEETKELNKYLDVLQAQVFDFRTEFIRSGVEVNYDNIKNKLCGVHDRPLSLIEIFKDHNRKMKELVGHEYAAGTLQRYETSLKHIQQFLAWKYKVSDVDIRKIDHSFITEFEFFLRSIRKCVNNSTVKYIKNFGKIIRICLDSRWIDRDPFSNFKSKLIEVKRIYLTEEELHLTHVTQG